MRDHADRYKPGQGVVPRRRQGRGHGGEWRSSQQQGVTIGGALGHGLRTQGARGTHPVFHHHRGFEQLGELASHQPPHGVGTGAGGKRHNDLDGAFWKSGSEAGLSGEADRTQDHALEPCAPR